MSNNAHDLSKRLLNALDSNYNVVDMYTVNEIISALEKFNITKELLETTRLGKHVNELRRKTSDPTLARRAKVLVKRWRDLVIPGAAQASPAHTGSNRSSAERQVRISRLGNTPLTSPAITRLVSPADPSSRPPSRPTWGGYESDSQDVILVDDDPPIPTPPSLAPTPSPSSTPLTPKRTLSPQPVPGEKKVKRDKKPKKRRGHSRAGTGAEETSQSESTWSARNGVGSPIAHTVTPAPPHHIPARRNGCRRPQVDAYAALVNRMPPAGSKKVKTTKELLEEIQSRGGSGAGRPSPDSPSPPGSPDVMLIEPDTCPLKVESPLRNGDNGSRLPTPLSLGPSPEPPSRVVSHLEVKPEPLVFTTLEDEREYIECTCGEEADDSCPAARRLNLVPRHVHSLHHTYIHGVNGTRAPLHPHQYAVRKLTDPEKPGLFCSIVPLYKYSDYADDYCVKNTSRVPLCSELPWTEFAPPPASPPSPPSPLPPIPYPTVEAPSPKREIINEDNTNEPSVNTSQEDSDKVLDKIEAYLPSVETVPCDRLKAPLLSSEERSQFDASAETKSEHVDVKAEVDVDHDSDTIEHRTVGRAKTPNSVGCDGRTLYELCERARSCLRYDFSQLSAAPLVSLSSEEGVLNDAFVRADDLTERDEFGRPVRATNFTEWHESARLGDLIALPYVVID